MARYASKVVEQARSWLGRNESNGTHKAIIDIYNAHKPIARGYKVQYTDEWCATFVSAVAIKLGYTKIIPTECSCTKMIELFKKLGAWNESDSRKPNPGDIIFYDWHDKGVGDNKSNPSHVGIVEKVSGVIITVIEGNKGEAVARRNIAVNGKYIRGYGVPKYDADPKPAKKSIAVIAQEVLDGKWGTGADRKKKLAAAGYDADAVQKKVNELTAAKKTKPATPKAGNAVKLNKGKLYLSSTGKAAVTRTGTFYLYDGVKVNGRYRVTNKASNVGKKPVALYVSGWVVM